MFGNLFAASLTCLFLLVAGCEKRATTSSSNQGTASPIPAEIDACTLITNDEVGAVQGSPVKETKSSARVNNGFRVAQCFYTADQFDKSVVLTVTQQDSKHPTNRTPKDFWNDTFGNRAHGEKEREGAREEGEKVAPPKRIDGVGDEAYWTGVRFGGALYVLKKDAFIRISIGGGDDEESKINKLKALALKAIERL